MIPVVALTVILVAGVLSLVPRLQRPLRFALVAAMLMAIAMLANRYAKMLDGSVRSLPEWDFRAFWIWGRMAVSGMDFYNPLSGAVFAEGRSREFVQEILNVGFWYPVPTILLFAPLGYFPAQHAIVGWYLVNILAFLAATLVLWRACAGNTGLSGLLAVLGLALSCHGVWATLETAQTGALALLLSSLMWLDRHSYRSGVWVALALVIKPFMIFWLAYLILLRNWRGFWAAIVVFASIAIAAGGLFGFDMYMQYIKYAPTSHVPVGVFSEQANQSLLAVLVRGFHSEATPQALPVRAAYLAFALVIGGGGVYVTIRSIRTQPQLAASILLMVALCLYPGTLYHYSVMGLAPMLTLWSVRGYFHHGALWWSLFATAFCCAGWIHNGAYAFWLNSVLLLVLTSVVVLLMRQNAQIKSSP
jgi:hypothetical protein